MEVTVGRASWDSLDEDLKGVIEVAVAATGEQTLVDFNFHNIEAYQKLTELAESDPQSRKIHDSHMDFLVQVRAYAPHADLGFLAMRNGGA